MFQLNHELIPRTFPLLPVSIVAIGLLLFLLLCGRTSPTWLAKYRKPHPALAQACLLPSSPLLLVPCITMLNEGWEAGLVGISFWAFLVLFACNPIYLLLCLLPIRPKGEGALFCWAFLLGVLATYCLFCFAVVLILMEQAQLPPGNIHGYFLLGGVLGLVAPACIKETRAPFLSQF